MMLHKEYYFIMILLFILSGTPYGNQYYTNLTIGTSVIIFLIYIWVKRKEKLKFNKTQFIVFYSLSLLLLVNMLLNADYDFNHYIGIWLTLLIGFFAMQIMDKSCFIKVYKQSLVFICAYSLIIYAYSLINSSFIYGLPYLFGEGTMWRNFHYIYFSWGDGAGLFLRNSACFREPGVFGVYICVALMFIISTPTHKKDIKIILLLGIAGLSTFSTTTIICIILLLISLFLMNKNRITKKNILVAFSFLPFISYALIRFLLEYNQQLFSKFNSNSQSYASFTDRYYGLITDIVIWGKNIFFGTGYTSYSFQTIGTTNSFTSSMAKYGILFTAIIIIGYFFLLLRMINRKIIHLINITVIVILFSTQNIILTAFFASLIFMGYKKV